MQVIEWIRVWTRPVTCDVSLSGDTLWLGLSGSEQGMRIGTGPRYHGLLRSQRAFVRGLGVFDPKSESKRKTLLDDGVPCATSAIVATVSRFTVTRVRGCILRSDSDPIRGSVGVLGLLSGLLCCDDITEAIGLMMKCLRSKEREARTVVPTNVNSVTALP